MIERYQKILTACAERTKHLAPEHALDMLKKVAQLESDIMHLDLMYGLRLEVHLDEAARPGDGMVARGLAELLEDQK